MPTLHAGVVGKQPRRASLTERQMIALGFMPKERPAKLGCGTSACVYLPSHADAVVKITRDPADALICHMLMSAPARWAIPVYGVHRVGQNDYVICAAKADPLPKVWQTLSTICTSSWKMIGRTSIADAAARSSGARQSTEERPPKTDTCDSP